MRRGGITALGETTAPAATTAPSPIVEPFNTTDPEEISTLSAMSAASMCTLWPTVQSLPISVGCRAVVWMIEPSWILVRSPTTM